ncbi:hypothetical protein BDV3_001583 [Batrachochytrium dendrobatidis]|uniref:Conserved oligomeric Golgi complex subunit 8 n=1 Tax=Batrachochytrium dendrobatidis (strain JEL423) TaxID=403673 RepID=A0A177WT76_BATDL|nr:hypothetical protein BDEG_26713 [Batrachochytrium dendrobatidis JEL423]
MSNIIHLPSDSATKSYAPLIQVLLRHSIPVNPSSSDIPSHIKRLGKSYSNLAHSISTANTQHSSDFENHASVATKTTAHHRPSLSVQLDPHKLAHQTERHQRRFSISQPLNQQQSSSDVMSSMLQPATSQISQSMFDANPELVAYFDHLTTSSLDAVKKEPEHLSAEQTRLSRQLSAVAFNEYRSFLRAHESCNDIRKELSSISTEIPKLTCAISSLKESISALSVSSTGISEKHRTLLLILAQHDCLIEILDIPKLFNTFIRGGYYEEAMSLRVHVQRLPSRYPNLPIVTRIAQQVDVSAEMMLSQLILLLRGNIKLPLCIRVIGYLRRMGALAESELRLVFLQQRDLYMSTRLAAIDGRVAHGVSLPIRNSTTGSTAEKDEQKKPDTWHQSRVEYLKRYIEISRELFFDIVTQYKAMFFDSQTVLSPLANSHSTTFPILGSGFGSSFEHISSSSHVYETSSSFTSQSILASYVTHVVNNFLSVLRVHLLDLYELPSTPQDSTQTLLHSNQTADSFIKNNIGAPMNKYAMPPALAAAPPIDDVSAVNSILTQTMYYGMSLGRVGIDFRQAVSGVFELAVERIVTTQMAHGVDTFVAWAVKTRLTGLYAVSIMGGSRSNTATSHTSLPDSLRSSVVSNLGSGRHSSGNAGASSTHQPPLALLSYPPLGTLLNTFLASFNQLRLLPCLSLIPTISSFIVTSLTLVSETTADLASSDWQLWSDTRRTELEDFCRAFVDILVPTVVHAFKEGVYGGLIDSSSDNYRIDCHKICDRVETWANTSRRRVSNMTATPMEPSNDASLTPRPQSVTDIPSVISNLKSSTDRIHPSNESLDTEPNPLVTTNSNPVVQQLNTESDSSIL